MPFKRMMEVGRVVLINYGPDKGKLATVVDIVDQNKCLVDGPESITGASRHIIPYARIAMTDYVVEVSKNASNSDLEEAWKSAEIMEKWENSSRAKKMKMKKTRASLNDFQRFKVMVARKQKREIIEKKMKELA